MRISEVASRSGVSTRMLRYYDKLGLLTPSGRTPAGYREYTEHDLLRLLRVEGLRALGLTLRQVAATLEADAPDPEALIAELIAQSRDRLDRERRLLDRLEQLHSATPSSWDDALAVVRLARGLDSTLSDDRLRAALAAGGSAALPQPALVSALLDEGDLNAAGALRWALAQSAEGPSALAGALSDPDPTRRRRAIAAIADFPGEEAARLLERGLTDTDAEVRAAAALALGGRGGDAAAEILLRLVETGPRDVEAAEALGVIARDPAAAERIVAALAARLTAPELSADSAGQAARARIAQALGEFDTVRAHALLASLAQDPDRAVARVARYLSSRDA